MKLKLLGLVALATVFLVGCEDYEEREKLIEKGLMFSEKPLEFVGYLDVESRVSSDTTYRYEVVKDPKTGCHYLFEDYNEVLSPYYGVGSTVYGCKEQSAKTDGSKVYSKEDYLNLLTEFYPKKDKSELEYMLENVFDYRSITFDEFKDKLEYLNKSDELEIDKEDNNKNSKEQDNDEK